VSIYRSAEGRAIALGLYDRRLDAWGDRVASTMIETPPLWTHVLRAGPADAPKVLAIPGSGGTALDFVDALFPLTDVFDVAFVDVPGEPGRSSEVPLGKGEAAADWLAALVEGLRWRAPAVIAMSGGALPVLRRPDLWSAAVLLVPEGLSRASTLGRLSSLVLPAVVHQIRPTDASLRRLARAACEPDDPAFLDVCVQLDAAVRHRLPPLPPAEPLPDEALAAFAVPTLVLAALRDRIFPGDALAARAGLLPHARVERVDTGHVSASFFAPERIAAYADALAGNIGP
jgi:pimeloyl-ACP methyl ester carboxylesterase